MGNLAGLKRKQVSKAVKEGRPITIENIGRWIRDIREVLGMTQKQMAVKLKISQPLFSKIEENAENCTVRTLAKIVRGLECEFMVVIFAKDGLESIIKKQAEIKANAALKRIFSTMALEKQAPSKSAYTYQLKKIIEELSNKPAPSLWEK